ncbi:conserved protein of unknown function [Shewanella benthica]|uniref:Uncharacterized protein n=1 Tax=Shewanella benthica TaxID=43661 RepID=A0A330M431_9GAMM|nr:hypothetical protein [Shewanella benthica]SQH76705.1 conserved protein of unknown function [Shewanella benthica]
MILKERDLEFNFTDAVDAIVFDEMKDKSAPNYHGIGLMHRVDFVVELEQGILFVEVKDPSNPKAQPKQIKKFLREVDDGTLGKTLASKYLDTFIYRWAEDKINKPVYYINLITLDEELLGNLSDEIEALLPPMNHSVPRWQKKFVNNCQVFNIESWNENFPKWPVRRIEQ